MRKPLALLLPLAAVLTACFSQTPTYTANDIVPEFKGKFGFGTNMGYFPPDYYDEQLAILAHGSPDGKVPGVGVTTIRPALFDHFLDYWGYQIRVPAFRLYDSIGLKDNVVFLGFPAERHRDSSFYCPNAMSEIFRDLYEPIWDDGQNGTPVNEKNPYALYVWKTVSTYKNYIKFWEVWNEPDLDLGGNGYKAATEEGNWWLNVPKPCETKLRAPAFYYIRMLRISYEVIKSLDPFAYVAVGGIGYPSYLDVICRLTDNPNGGAVSTKYPKKGGAYFDCLSYHSYPHIENAMRVWSNRINGFEYFRHSDAGLDGVWEKKRQFQQVLNRFGYDGATYPEKTWIITEINIPRRQFGEFIGSDEAQTNFMMKSLITAPANGLLQMHIYALADEVPEAEAKNEFGFMGLFENLKDIKPFAGRANQVAVGFKTTSDLLYGKHYDSLTTKALQLPPNIRGAAFRDDNGQLTFALWAVTSRDRDEWAYATYDFPEELNIKYLDKKYWHFSKSGAHNLTNAKQVALNGTPAFFTPADVSENTYPKTPRVLPNPVSTGYSVYSFWMFQEGEASIEVFDSAGRRVQTLAQAEIFSQGAHQLLLDWTELAAGTYFIRLISGEEKTVVPVVKI